MLAHVLSRTGVLNYWVALLLGAYHAPILAWWVMSFSLLPEKLGRQSYSVTCQIVTLLQLLSYAFCCCGCSRDSWLNNLVQMIARMDEIAHAQHPEAPCTETEWPWDILPPRVQTVV